MLDKNRHVVVVAVVSIALLIGQVAHATAAAPSVEYAQIGGNQKIKFSIGAGELYGPEDAVVFPSGNR